MSPRRSVLVASGVLLVFGVVTALVALMVLSYVLPSLPFLLRVFGLVGLAAVAAVVGFSTNQWKIALVGFGLLVIGAYPFPSTTGCLACACAIPDGYVYSQHIRLVFELSGGLWPLLRITAKPVGCICGCPFYTLHQIPLLGGYAALALGVVGMEDYPRPRTWR